MTCRNSGDQYAYQMRDRPLFHPGRVGDYVDQGSEGQVALALPDIVKSGAAENQDQRVEESAFCRTTREGIEELEQKLATRLRLQREKEDDEVALQDRLAREQAYDQRQRSYQQDEIERRHINKEAELTYQQRQLYKIEREQLRQFLQLSRHQAVLETRRADQLKHQAQHEQRLAARKNSHQAAHREFQRERLARAAAEASTDVARGAPHQPSTTPSTEAATAGWRRATEAGMADLIRQSPPTEGHPPPIGYFARREV